jgi:hypothetical protein
VAEYEVLVLGLRAVREIGIQEVVVFRDVDLVVQQIKSTYQAKHPRIKSYRNDVWELIDSFFLAFNISFVLREKNIVADSLATSAGNFKVPFPPKFKYDVEVKYKPSIPDNVKHWKVFEDDLKIKKFLETVKEFSEMHIDQDSVSEEKLDGGNFLNKIAERDIVQLPNNHIPRGLVPLEMLFDRNDVSLKGEILEDDAGAIRCNIGTESEPKFVNLSRSLEKEKRSEYVGLLREFADVFSWTYEDLKTYDTSVIDHKILLKGEANPFKKKLKQINPMLLPIMEREVKKLLQA